VDTHIPKKRNLYQKLYKCNLIVPSLQSSEVHIEVGQSLESIGRVEEVSFEF